MFVINIPYLDLDQCYLSGQIFRWIKFRDGKYCIPHGNKCLKIEQVKDRFILNCTDEEFYDRWYEYFDLGTDYMNLNYKIRSIDEEFKPKVVRARGVRILKQDLFEITITFMLATATNMQNVKRLLEQISQKCGVYHKQQMRECGAVKWYEFPTHEMILEKRNRLDNSFGLHRKENILQLCEDIEKGWVDLSDLYNMSYREAREYLQYIDGIGPKVADCICLYGLHMMESFPVDTHIKQIIQRDFGCDSKQGFFDWYLGDIQEKGLVQQYMFYNEVNPPKEVKKVGVNK